MMEKDKKSYLVAGALVAVVAGIFLIAVFLKEALIKAKNAGIKLAIAKQDILDRARIRQESIKAEEENIEKNLKEAYSRIVIPLDTARVDEEMNIAGDYINIIRCSGTPSSTWFELNHRNAGSLHPNDFTDIKGSFSKIYMNNAAEAGKELIMHVGSGLDITTSGGSRNEKGQLEVSQAEQYMDAKAFQLNPGFGTFKRYSSGINDGSVLSYSSADAINQFIEIDFDKTYTISEFRFSGVSTNDGDGIWKLQYWDQEEEDWLDWRIEDLGEEWKEKAPKLGVETQIRGLTQFNNRLYGGTSPNGMLYEWNGVDAWVEVAPKLGAETEIIDLCVYNNKIYGGTWPNGKLYEWNGTNLWVEVAPQLAAQTGITSLCVYNGKLYGGTYPNGKLFEWNDVNAWVEKAPQEGIETSISSLIEFNGRLYSGTNILGKLYRWNDVDAWEIMAQPLTGGTCVFDTEILDGKLYAGMSPNGALYEWNGVDAWVEVAPKLGTESAIVSIEMYNNKIYGGTWANGMLFEWNGTDAWTLIVPQLGSETRIWKLQTFNNMLFGGTYPNGKLYSYDDFFNWAIYFRSIKEEEYTDWIQGMKVDTKKIRLVCMGLDSSGFSRIRELEMRHI